MVRMPVPRPAPMPATARLSRSLMFVRAGGIGMPAGVSFGFTFRSLALDTLARVGGAFTGYVCAADVICCSNQGLLRRRNTAKAVGLAEMTIWSQ
jgi:hypothetical protein